MPKSPRFPEGWEILGNVGKIWNVSKCVGVFNRVFNRQTFQKFPGVLGAAGPGCRDAQFQRDWPEGAAITRGPVWVGFAWAILAAFRRNPLELLPVQPLELAHNMAGHFC